MEFAVKWMYSVDKALVMPYQDSLVSLMNTEDFRDIVGADIWRRMDLIRRMGNNAAHTGRKITEEQAALCLENLYVFLDFVAYCYGENYTEGHFDRSLLTQPAAPAAQGDSPAKGADDIDLAALMAENAALKEELTAIRDKYGDDRLTEIQDVEDEIDIEDLIEEEQCVFTLSHAGYCKRVPASTYRSQKRGGRGVTGMTTKEEDFVEGVFTASTHDYILFFTNLGKVHRRKGYQIPEAGRTAKGTNLVNILPFEPGEKVTAGITVHEFDEDYLVFVTRNGTVKRLELASLNTARKAGIRALTLSEGDELIAVMKTDGKQDILLASANGMVICFNENDVRVMGRDAAGVRGIALDADDYVVGAGIAAEGKQLLTVTENGYGKRTEIEAYLRLGEDGQRRPQNRGGKGLKNYNITAKTGRIAGVAIVSGEDDVMLIENGGVLIRMAASDINVYKRDTQGVILMRVEEGNRVISIERVDPEQEEE